MPIPAGQVSLKRPASQIRFNELGFYEAAVGDLKGPPLLHRIYEPSHHADIALQLAVNNGVHAHHWQFGDMAPLPQVTPGDVAHSTAYVRAEQKKAGIR